MRRLGRAAWGCIRTSVRHRLRYAVPFLRTFSAATSIRSAMAGQAPLALQFLHFNMPPSSQGCERSIACPASAAQKLAATARTTAGGAISIQAGRNIHALSPEFTKTLRRTLVRALTHIGRLAHTHAIAHAAPAVVDRGDLADEPQTPPPAGAGIFMRRWTRQFKKKSLLKDPGVRVARQARIHALVRGIRRREPACGAKMPATSHVGVFEAQTASYA